MESIQRAHESQAGKSLHFSSYEWIYMMRFQQSQGVHQCFDPLHHRSVKAISRMLMVVYYILQNSRDSKNSGSVTEGATLPGHFVTGADFHCIHVQRPEWGYYFLYNSNTACREIMQLLCEHTIFTNAAIPTVVPMAFRCCYHYEFAFSRQKKKASLLLHSISYKT